MNLRHHSLVAWQRADDLFIKIHRLSSEQFPPAERFELASQLRRAAFSVPANIVEAFARRYRRARLNFLNIAEASLSETWYCLHAARRLGYIDQSTFEKLETELNGVGAPLEGLIRSTRRMPLEVGLTLLAGIVIGVVVTVAIA